MNRRLAAIGVVAVVASAGCASTPKPSVDIGMARVGLTRAFTDETLEPLPPEVLIRLVPAAIQTMAPPDLPQPADAPPEPPVALCPAAPAGATVPEPASIAIGAPPKPGFYRLYNEGTIEVASGPIALKLPFPAQTYQEVSDVREVEVETVPGLPGTPRTQFTLTTTLSPTYVVTEVFQYDAGVMDLISRVETNEGVVVTDDWLPPVQVFDTGGPGSTWQDIATNLEDRRTLTIDGAIDKRAVVDACGSLIETIEVQSRTTVVDLATTQTSGTTPGATDIARVATTLGGLFAQRETHSTTTRTVDGLPVTITIDVKSTLVDLAPTAEPPA